MSRARGRQQRRRAVVVGGSVAGLLAARVLSDHYAEVAVVDRDELPREPRPRKGVPQSVQPHLLLPRGLQLLERLFPGFHEQLMASGAARGDADRWRFVSPAGELPRAAAGRPGVGATRALLEWCIRVRVAGRANVRFLTETEVTGVTGAGDGRRVTGVEVRSRRAGRAAESLAADLVVDASGRHSQAPAWLEAFGCGGVPEDQVTSSVGYSSRLYRLPECVADAMPNLVIQPRPPHNPRLGILIAVEDGLWYAFLGGAAGHFPPTTETGFLEWARALPDSSLFDALQCGEPVSPIRGFRVPTTHRRRFERLPRWPEGFVVIGDAVCSFNPFYAQGMTVAALEAMALGDTLLASGGPGWERRFQRRLAQVVADPWKLGCGEDLRWPEVRRNGKPAGPGDRLVYRYLDRLLPAACADPVVSETFQEVIGLLAPSSRLFRPGVVGRVLVHSLRGAAGRTSAPPALPANLSIDAGATPTN